MEIAIRAIGNSKGIFLRKPVQAVRAGWSEAAAAIATRGADVLLMGEFGNVDDEGLTW
jgi:antitoxin MazE